MCLTYLKIELHCISPPYNHTTRLFFYSSDRSGTSGFGWEQTFLGLGNWKGLWTHQLFFHASWRRPLPATKMSTTTQMAAATTRLSKPLWMATRPALDSSTQYWKVLSCVFPAGKSRHTFSWTGLCGCGSATCCCAGLLIGDQRVRNRSNKPCQAQAAAAAEQARHQLSTWTFVWWGSAPGSSPPKKNGQAPAGATAREQSCTSPQKHGWLFWSTPCLGWPESRSRCPQPLIAHNSG